MKRAFLLLASAWITLCGSRAIAQENTPATLGVFDRIAVIGASASDGFRVGVVHTEHGITAREGEDIDDILARSIRCKPSILTSLATDGYFLAPFMTCHAQIERALRAKPTLVLALDSLFWHLYGTTGVDGALFESEDDRIRSFIAALGEIDQLVQSGAVVIVGDVPDLTSAPSTMLGPAMYPKSETIARANALLREWAKQRTRVRLLAVDALMAINRREEPVAFGGIVWDPKKDGPLMQKDRLHPTFDGTVALIAGAIELVRDADPSARVEFELDPRVLRGCICAELAVQIEQTQKLEATRQIAPSN